MSLNSKIFADNISAPKVGRSKFKIPFEHKTTFKAGDLIPIYSCDILPGDSVDMNLSEVTRMLTPAVPVMDNAWLDIYFFFVPNRLLAKCPGLFNGPSHADWETFCGANKDGAWAPTVETTVKSISLEHVNSMSVGNYLGLPIGAFINSGVCPKILPYKFIAYNMIWNDFFRDETTQAPIDLRHGFSFPTTPDGLWALSNSYPGSYGIAGSCLKANKYPDYFTRSLPAPQRGPNVLLPLGGLAPVSTFNDSHSGSNHPLRGSLYNKAGSLTVNTVELGTPTYSSDTPNDAQLFPPGSLGTGTYFSPNNLWTDLSQATASTVSQLRQAFAIQRFYEAMARAGGGRYIEILKGIFGTAPSDSRLQRPEFLSGKHIPLMISQVLQTSATVSDSPLGNTGAVSQTNDYQHHFTASFTEFGQLIGLAVVRNEQSYSQGLSKEWTKFRFFDNYLPQFAHLSEMPVFKRELYLEKGALSSEVFGYQEAWAEYRFKPNLITGNLAPAAGDLSLTPWTFTTNFSAAPTLNDDFKRSDSSQIGATLVDTSTLTQFVADFYFDATFVRPMPVDSYPGLIDHF